jgi:hypothetical protein
MKRSTTFSGLFLSVVFLAGFGPCSQPSETAPPESATKLAKDLGDGAKVAPGDRVATRQQTQSVSEVMHQHALEARDARNAVIAGRLDDARSAASKIASDDWTPHLRLNHLLYVSAVRSAARAMQKSTSLSGAAVALGEVGATCAACHRSTGGPVASPAATPSDGSKLSMAAHVAAEKALWEGLVNPSDASWATGARGLLEAPELDSDDEEVSLLARRTRELAREAATATSTRGDVYGRIVETCSGCHVLLAATK